MAAVSRHLKRWTRWHIVGAAILAALGVVVTSGAFADIYAHAASNEESSHIFLVPLVAAWMVWVRAGRARYCRPTMTLLGPMIVVIGWMSWSYGYWHNRDTFYHAGAIVLVLGCVVSVLGKHALTRFFPAVLVLAFLVPVPNRWRQKLAVPLQNFTARTAQTTMEVMGVDVQRDENQLIVNGQPVNIIEACNGMRMVFPLILVGFAFSYGMPLKQWVRILLVVLSPLAAIFCNVLRILPTVWIYGYGSTRLGEQFHFISGWMMLPFAFLLLLATIRVLRWAMIPVMRYTLASQ
jgi:exosortase